MSKERITYEILESGQPRPYADSKIRARVIFEHTRYNEQTGELKPWLLNAKGAENVLRMRGFIGKLPWKKDITHGLDTHIVYINPIDADAGGMSHIWEYYICTPFCD